MFWDIPKEERTVKAICSLYPKSVISAVEWTESKKWNGQSRFRGVIGFCAIPLDPESLKLVEIALICQSPMKWQCCDRHIVMVHGA